MITPDAVFMTCIVLLIALLIVLITFISVVGWHLSCRMIKVILAPIAVSGCSHRIEVLETWNEG